MNGAPSFVFATAAGAFAAGIGGSVHCVLMCGPLACAATVGNAAQAASSRLARAAAWHGSRIAAYAVVGAVLGLAGQGVSRWLATSVQPFLPWLVALGLMLSAFDWARRLPAIPGLGAVASGLARWGSRFSAAGRAALLGCATPFLPCGLLYGLFLAAAATGSAQAGALIMASFALGAVPAFVLLQSGSGSLERWPRLVPVLRRAIPLLAAAAVLWRAIASSGVSGAGGEPTHHH